MKNTTVLPLVGSKPRVRRRKVLGLVLVQLVKLHGEPREAEVEVVVFGHASGTPHDTGGRGMTTVEGFCPLAEEVVDDLAVGVCDCPEHLMTFGRPRTGLSE